MGVLGPDAHLVRRLLRRASAARRRGRDPAARRRFGTARAARAHRRSAADRRRRRRPDVLRRCARAGARRRPIPSATRSRSRWCAARSTPGCRCSASAAACRSSTSRSAARFNRTSSMPTETIPIAGLRARSRAMSTRSILEPGSLAARAVGRGRPHGRCHHHQAVLDVGDGLVVTGRAADEDVIAKQKQL